MFKTLSLTLALTAHQAAAAIVDDGLWTGNDWYDATTKIGVRNGVPYSDDAMVQSRLDSRLTSDEPNDAEYMTRANVQRVMSFFKPSDWPIAFPIADPIYTYDNFLKAVAKFPFFCNETNIAGQTLDETCRREIAGLFAHWGQETGKRQPGEGEFWQQALYHVEEIRCKGTTDPSCDYKQGGWADDAWPAQPDQQYYGRGPFQLSWNYNYGQFSNVFDTPSSYNSKLFLLKNPDLLHEDGYLPMAAGIWFYMTPQDPKPSMHDVMTGFFVPNKVDQQNNITATFGTTINIINGGFECGHDSSKARSRGEYFLEWLNFFDMPPEDGLSCAQQQSYFPYGGAGDVPGYWAQDWSGKIACQPAGYQTAYSINARDDYKRCVCDIFGEGAEDCPTAEGGDDDEEVPEPDDGGDDEEVPEPDEGGDDEVPEPDNETQKEYEKILIELAASLKQIEETPFEPYTGQTMTFSQIQRRLDLVSEKLIEVLTVLSA